MRLSTLYKKAQMSALCRGERDVASTDSFVSDLSSGEVDDTYPKCSNREEIVLKYIPGEYSIWLLSFTH